MSSSNQRPANQGFRSVLRCAITHCHDFRSLSAPEPCDALRCVWDLAADRLVENRNRR